MLSETCLASYPSLTLMRIAETALSAYSAGMAVCPTDDEYETIEGMVDILTNTELSRLVPVEPSWAATGNSCPYSLIVLLPDTLMFEPATTSPSFSVPSNCDVIQGVMTKSVAGLKPMICTFSSQHAAASDDMYVWAVTREMPSALETRFSMSLVK